MNWRIVAPADRHRLGASAGTDGQTHRDKRRQETTVNMITETELKLENRIIRTGVWRKHFNRYVAKSLTSCCLTRKKVGGGPEIVQVPLWGVGHLSQPLPRLHSLLHFRHSKSQHCVNTLVFVLFSVCCVNCFEINVFG
jgi:hypothetical protein